MCAESRHSRSIGELQQALVNQISHLVEEVEALKTHLNLVPKEVLSGRPMADALTFKEIYALLALFDERVFLPALRGLETEGVPRVTLPSEQELLGDTDWNARSIEDLLDAVKRERAVLVDVLRAMEGEQWRNEIELDDQRIDLTQFAHWIVQHDAVQLRTAAFRLYESRLTSREEDLPK